MIPLALGILSVLLLHAAPVPASESAPTLVDLQRLPASPAVRIDAQAATWRYRGRVSFPLLATLKTRLKDAGLSVTESEDAPHDLVLKVDYREERGREFRFDLYATDIVAQIELTQPGRGSLLHLTVRASSRYPQSESRPYVDAIEQFETNPYFYFLGEIVSGRLQGQTDMTAILIQALERMPEQGQAMDDHSLMLPSETLHVTWARQNAMQELGRLGDPRAVPVLARLMEHTDWRIRLASVGALREIGSDPARAAIERASRQDPDPEVRSAAVTALAGTGPSGSRPR